MGICRLWQPVRRRDGRACPACPMASIAQYSRACPPASSIACRKAAKGRIRHTLARQRNAFPLGEGQQQQQQQEEEEEEDGNAKPDARDTLLSAGRSRRCSRSSSSICCCAIYGTLPPGAGTL